MKKTLLVLLALAGLTMPLKAQEINPNSNTNESDTTALSAMPYAYYAEQYAQFERMAMNRFSILTASGTAGTSTRPISGTSKMSLSDFNTHNALLRNAQQQMRQIRSQASAAGHALPLSPWEDARVELTFKS